VQKKIEDRRAVKHWDRVKQWDALTPADSTSRATSAATEYVMNVTERPSVIMHRKHLALPVEQHHAAKTSTPIKDAAARHVSGAWAAEHRKQKQDIRKTEDPAHVHRQDSKKGLKIIAHPDHKNKGGHHLIRVSPELERYEGRKKRVLLGKLSRQENRMSQLVHDRRATDRMLEEQIKMAVDSHVTEGRRRSKSDHLDQPKHDRHQRDHAQRRIFSLVQSRKDHADFYDRQIASQRLVIDQLRRQVEQLDAYDDDDDNQRAFVMDSNERVHVKDGHV